MTELLQIYHKPSLQLKDEIRLLWLRPNFVGPKEYNNGPPMNPKHPHKEKGLININVTQSRHD